MDINEMINALNAVVAKLRHHIPFAWHYAQKPVGNPRKPTFGRSALSIPFDQLRPMAKGKSWFYADVHFPKSLYGFQCGNTKALMTIWGWVPFTLWIDGREQFKEQHAWMATGPIVSPIHIPITPAKPVRLVLCLEAPEWPHVTPVFHVQITPEACMKTALLVSAAAAQLKFASVLAETEDESKLVIKAANCIDFNALSHYRWNDALNSLERMEQALFFLSERAKSVTVHCIGHSHIDMDWQWPWKDTISCIRRDFKSVLDIQDDFPEVTFIHSQIPSYEVIRQRDPDLFQKKGIGVRAGH